MADIVSTVDPFEVEVIEVLENVGPQGAPGPKGDPGEPGPKGDKGDKGDDAAINALALPENDGKVVTFKDGEFTAMDIQDLIGLADNNKY